MNKYTGFVGRTDNVGFSSERIAKIKSERVKYIKCNCDRLHPDEFAECFKIGENMVRRIMRQHNISPMNRKPKETFKRPPKAALEKAYTDRVNRLVCLPFSQWGKEFT